MAGRKPVEDDRRKHVIAMNVSDKDFGRFNDYLARTHYSSSRAWLAYQMVFGIIDGDYVGRSDVIPIPNHYDYSERKFCEKILTDQEFLDRVMTDRVFMETVQPVKLTEDERTLLDSILSDETRRKRLFEIIVDSKHLSGES